jgi:hypothetical protein
VHTTRKALRLQDVCRYVLYVASIIIIVIIEATWPVVCTGTEVFFLLVCISRGSCARILGGSTEVS